MLNHTQRPRWGALATTILAALPAIGYAQSVTPVAAEPSSGAVSSVVSSVVSRDAEGVPTLRAVRLTTPLTLDGALDEEFYRTVEGAGDLVQQDPKPGAPASERTEVWIFFDDRTFYVAARLWSSHPEEERTNDLRRDAPAFRGTGDSFSIAMDTFHDRRNGYQFGVTPYGGLYDSLSANERDINRDWNGVWRAKTTHFKDGWSVEIAIPFKTLRYAPGDAQVWGFNVCRIIAWKNERAYFTRIPPALGSGSGILKFSSAAPLVGLVAPPTSRLLEVKPYVIGDLQTNRSVRPSIENDPSGDFGVDAKVGVTSGLALDLTYNTDFAQVEQDEQQVNLTRFSLFFPEKREFFLEGQGLFAFGGYGQLGNAPPGDLPLLFFSRTIGLNNGRVVPIAGGARLTGKSGRYSIGAVNIQTREDALLSSPATNFAVFRVKRDILRRSSIGALVARRSQAAVGPGSNETYGADATFSFFQNLNFNTYFAWTRTEARLGDDTSHRVQLDYNADRYGLQVERLFVDRNFNPEVGFSRRQDFAKHYVFGRFSPRPTFVRSVRKFAYEGSVDRYVNTRGRLELQTLQATFRTEFQSSDQLSAQFTDTYEVLPGAFRIFGNVVIPGGEYHDRTLRVSYQGGAQRAVSGTVALDVGSLYGGNKTSLTYSSGRINVRRVAVIEPSISLNWVDVPQGVFTAKVVTTRVTYPISQRTAAMVLLQYNSTTNSLTTNARLRWEYTPGSELFLVYSEGRDTLTGGLPDLTSRGIVVKMTRFLRR